MGRVALLRLCDRCSSCIDGRDVLIIFSAILNTLWMDFWSAAVQLLCKAERIAGKIFSIVPLYKVVRTGRGSFTFLMCLRKC